LRHDCGQYSEEKQQCAVLASRRLRAGFPNAGPRQNPAVGSVRIGGYSPVVRVALYLLAGAAVGGLIGGFGFANYRIPPEDEVYRNWGIALYAVLGATAGAVVVGGIAWAVWLDRNQAQRRRERNWR
jgi:hypothetical protein